MLPITDALTLQKWSKMAKKWNGETSICIFLFTTNTTLNNLPKKKMQKISKKEDMDYFFQK